MKSISGSVILFLIITHLVDCQNSCQSREKCSECIQELGCIWCLNPKNPSEKHCMVETSSTCDNFISPKISIYTSQNRPLSDKIHLKPQKVMINLRKGGEINFHFTYKRSKNYPLDVYFLMDLSATMNKHRETLAKFGEKLANNLTEYAKNVRFGFGSFIDKVMVPFVNTEASALNKPCEFEGEPCVPAYAFKNHLSLTSNYKKFVKSVKEAQVSGNIDSSEGGLDALMQAIVCEKEINWRTNEARKVIVFLTDAESHISGDGKMGGIVLPNDFKCHLYNNIYKGESVDYPSVSQIKYISRNNSISIIFGIVENQDTVFRQYESFTRIIDNSKLGKLNNNSENIIELIVKNYQEIVETVEMTSTRSENLDVQFSSNCKHKSQNGCEKVAIAEEITFTATVKALKCPFSNNTEIIKIKSTTLQEFITVEVLVTCDCDCENELLDNSPICTNNGMFKCGICYCSPGRYGEKCECNQNSQSNNITMCQNDFLLCSNRGTCICGNCKCRESEKGEIYGKFCECDDFSCKSVDNRLCSGKGECDCGNCNCNAGWTGEACDCTTSEEQCRSSYGNKNICSGHGACKCGKCVCETVENEQYMGKFCEECSSCPSQKCDELKSCVECVTQEEKNNTDCNQYCTNYKTELVNELASEPAIKQCKILDENGCYTHFQYTTDVNYEIKLSVKKNKICPERRSLTVISLASILGTVLLGLIILAIWKFVTYYYDRREYAKFEKERKYWQRQENPLYRPAVTNFINPSYRPL